MKPTTLILFLLIIASSCTIEKRIHRPGRNVQWRKHHAVSQKQDKSSTSLLTKEIHQGVNTEPTLNREKKVLVNEKNNAEQESFIELVSDQELNSAIDATEISPEDTTKKVVHSTRPYLQDFSDAKKNQTKGVRNRESAITSLVIGLICALLAILLYFAISSMVELLMLIFAVLALVVLIVIAFMLILVGLTLLIVKPSNRTA